MTWRGRLRARLGIALAVQVLGCASAGPRGKPITPDALSSFVVWSEAARERGTGLGGTPLDIVPVKGGEILRLQTEDDVPLRIGERVSAGRTFAESWSTLSPQRSTVVLRVGALSSALLLPRSTVGRVYRGHGSDPGYEWFSLEDRVLQWARGPLPGTFPRVAPAERLDYGTFAALDQVLAEAVARSDRELDRAAARALRTVLGLRAIRALRPVTGLPYFFDSLPRPTRAIAADGVHPTYVVDQAHPLDLAITGPALLHVWMRPSNALSPSVELSVFEGSKRRARAEFTAPRSAMTHYDPALPNSQSPTLQSRALVHVPPGAHHYAIETSAETHVTPLLAEPIVHLEEASTKDEGAQLARARLACQSGGAAPLCALALALLGLDLRDRELDGTPSAWARALSLSPPNARALAIDIGGGAPWEPVAELERAAATHDGMAMRALGGAVSESVDERTRAAWVHAMTRNSEWRLADDGEQPARWISVASDASPPGLDCPSHGIEDVPELTDVERDYPTRGWHGARSLELLVVSQCADKQPIELLVDGQRIVGNPSAAVVRWQILVRGDSAKVRRLDHGQARLFAHDSGCARTFDSLRAPVLASIESRLRFGPVPTAVGVEVWFRAKTERAELRFSAPEGSHEPHEVELIVPRAPGLTAYDAEGSLWTRVGRFALPDWANEGVRFSAGKDVALRALIRVPSESSGKAHEEDALRPAAPEPLDEAELVRETRGILNTPPERRGPLYFERGLKLAAGGAELAALADARAARALGKRGPKGEDAVDFVRAAVRSRTSVMDGLPEGLSAYGVNTDFDPDARKCEAARGPRFELDQSFAARPPAALRAAFDVAKAVRAVRIAEQVPLDPRAKLLVARAFRGSRWKLLPPSSGSTERVKAQRRPALETPISPDGELSPSVATGLPFESGTYATVRATHPARALLAATANETEFQLEFACVSRDPSATDEPCPLSVLVDRQSVSVDIAQDGRGHVVLERSARARSVDVALRPGPGDWVALARIVTNRALPNAVNLDATKWVVVPRSFETRTLLRRDASLSLSLMAPTVLRVDSRREGSSPAELIIGLAGHERRVSASGTSLVPVPNPQEMSLTARGGTISITVAEIVPSERVDSEVSARAVQLETTRRVAVAGLSLDSPRIERDTGWFEIARKSPPPLTPIEAALGTFIAETGVVSGGGRRTPTLSASADAYAFELVGYRRRIESIDLWTRAEAFSRTRLDHPTYGAEGSLYEDLEKQHLRLTTTLKIQTQEVAGQRGRSWSTRGFIEYSYRAAKEIFVLPRLGYDGMYSSIARRPTSLSFVDAEVYDPYRARRPTFLFAQALFWYAPYFNEILALRLRGTLDAKSHAFSHSAAVLNGFLAFGNLDLSGQAQALWYVARDSISRSAHVAALLGGTAEYSFWSGLGSLALVPGIATQFRPADAAWQVSAFVNVLASFRRGRRDFSSLELDFPEQLGGSIPWRGSTPGGYR